MSRLSRGEDKPSNDPTPGLLGTMAGGAAVSYDLYSGILDHKLILMVLGLPILVALFESAVHSAWYVLEAQSNQTNGIYLTRLEIRHKRRITVAAASKILANLTYAYKGYGLSMGTMLCGVRTPTPTSPFITPNLFLSR